MLSQESMHVGTRGLNNFKCKLVNFNERGGGEGRGHPECCKKNALSSECATNNFRTNISTAGGTGTEVMIAFY